MKAWRTEIATETLAALVSLAGCCVAIFALDASPPNDHTISSLNGVIALLLGGVVAIRFLRGTGDGLARTGWIIAGAALTLFAVTQFFERPFEAIEQTFHLEDADDVALLLVLPLAVLLASRAEGFGRNAMLFVAAAAAAQAASTVIDLMDGPLARTETLTVRETEVLVDLSEFVFLQLYLIGLAVAPLRGAATPIPAPRPLPRRQSEEDWFKRRGLSPKRFYFWHVVPALWRLRHPSRTPEDFYASMIRRQIRDGHFHPAIGRTARSVRARSELLDILRDRGMKPSHTVVDYGCGSFRLGRPLIEYLEPGKYWGLDVVEDFMTIGLGLLDPDLVSAKRPQALLINAENLACACAAAPDFIVSWHVCSKVPPRRLRDYFGKMIALMGRETLMLVHFPETDRRRRQSRFSWSQSRGAITAVIHSIDPRLEVRFDLITDQVAMGVSQTMVQVRRR
jgi:hypothetical protein